MKRIPEYIKILVLTYLVICTVLISVGNILLWFYIKDRKTKASSFIRAIILAVIPVVSLSMSLIIFKS